jgi:hypothetical protein
MRSSEPDFNSASNARLETKARTCPLVATPICSSKSRSSSAFMAKIVAAVAALAIAVLSRLWINDELWTVARRE